MSGHIYCFFFFLKLKKGEEETGNEKDIDALQEDEDSGPFVSILLVSFQSNLSQLREI